MFTLSEPHFDGTNNLTKNISDEFAENLIISMKNLGNNMRCHYLFQIVKRNLAELTFYMQSKQNDIKNIDAIECNRYLFNFVGTFYSYINFYEKNYNELFKDVKKHIYDTYFEYRFIYNLRNYIIHEDLAILRISKKFWQDHVDVNFEIDNNALSDSSCCQQRFKQELKSCSARMTNLHDVLSNFYIILLRLHIDMLTKIWQTLRTDFLLLMDNIPNRQEIYLLQDGKIKNGLLNVTTKYYKCVSDNFVYAENLLQEENVNKFYLDISFLYYKERYVLYLGKPNN